MQYHLIMAGAGVSDGSGNNGYFDNQASCYLVPGETGVARWWRGRVSVSPCPRTSQRASDKHRHRQLRLNTTAVSTSFQSFYYTNNKWSIHVICGGRVRVTEYLDLVLWMSVELKLIFNLRIFSAPLIYEIVMNVSCFILSEPEIERRGEERTQLRAEMGLQHQPQHQTSVSDKCLHII